MLLLTLHCSIQSDIANLVANEKICCPELIVWNKELNIMYSRRGQKKLHISKRCNTVLCIMLKSIR